MKKIICLALCVIMSCFALVACNDEIGSELYGKDGYYDRGFESNKSEPASEIDIYLAVDDSVDFTKADVITQYSTIESEMNALIGDKYNVKVFLHYINEADYAATIAEAVKPGYKYDSNFDGDVDDERVATADIVLINSKALYDGLIGKDADGNLTGQNMLLPLDSQLSKSTYGTLKALIPDVLWDLTTEKVTELDDGGEPVVIATADYVVPNNRVIGEYTYVTINKKDFSNAKLLYSDISNASINTETAVDIFKKMYGDADYEAKLAECTVKGNYADCPRNENGTINDYAVDSEYYYRVLEYPIMADKDEAFESAFAVVRDNANALRSMDIIYAFNNNKDLKNLLQFGKKNVNYTIDENGFVHPTEKNVYKMNPLYTGNIFNMYYFDDTDVDAADQYDWNYVGIEKWTEELCESGLSQNDEADSFLKK